MKPHNPETDSAVQGPTQGNSPAEEQKIEPQGSFSLRPAGRKKQINWKIAGVIGGGILLVLIITIVFGAAVINSRSDNETVVDETRVKAVTTDPKLTHCANLSATTYGKISKKNAYKRQ